MDFGDLLQRAGIEPQLVCVKRHTLKGLKNFSQLLEDWAQNNPDAFNGYRRRRNRFALDGNPLKKNRFFLRRKR